jgi:galactokinase
MREYLQNTKANCAELFVPGRLCLFGEHSDWAADYGIHRGYCIVTGTDQGITASATPGDRFVVETILPDTSSESNCRIRQMSCPWKAESLLAAARDETEFFRYCAGVAYEGLTRLKISNGIEVRITSMDLPLKKGVSSSAAVCIAMAKALDEVYELGLFPQEIMQLAYLGERLTRSQCGRMDQACVYGRNPVLLTFDKTKGICVEPISVNDTICMFFVDLAGKKDTITILSDLQSNYLKSEQIQKALGKDNERIARLAYRAISAGDAEQVGVLMTKAQHNFDTLIAPYSKENLSSPLLHRIINFDRIAEHIYGGKGVGSQGDGTAQFVCRSAADRDAAMAEIEAAFPQMTCFPLTISPRVSSPNRQEMVAAGTAT